MKSWHNYTLLIFLCINFSPLSALQDPPQGNNFQHKIGNNTNAKKAGGLVIVTLLGKFLNNAINSNTKTRTSQAQAHTASSNDPHAPEPYIFDDEKWNNTNPFAQLLYNTGVWDKSTLVKPNPAAQVHALKVVYEILDPEIQENEPLNGFPKRALKLNNNSDDATQEDRDNNNVIQVPPNFPIHYKEWLKQKYVYENGNLQTLIHQAIAMQAQEEKNAKEQAQLQKQLNHQTLVKNMATNYVTQNKETLEQLASLDTSHLPEQQEQFVQDQQQAIETMLNGAYDWQQKNYTVDKTTREFLQQHNINPTEVSQFYGNQLQHINHQQALQLMSTFAHSQAAKEQLPSEVVGELYALAYDLNMYGKTIQAGSVILNGLWWTVDCFIVAPIEGVGLGVKNTVVHTGQLAYGLVFDTKNTVFNFAHGLGQLSVVLTRLAAENTTRRWLYYYKTASFVYNKGDTSHADKLLKTLHKHSLGDKICKEIINTPPRELTKQATAAAVEIFLTRKIHAAAGNILIRSAQAGAQLSGEALEVLDWIASLNPPGGTGGALALADGGVQAVPEVLAEALTDPAILSEITSATGLLAGAAKQFENINLFEQKNSQQQGGSQKPIKWIDPKKDRMRMRQVHSNKQDYQSIVTDKVKKIIYDIKHIFESEHCPNNGIKGLHHDHLNGLEKAGKIQLNVTETHPDGYYQADVMANGKIKEGNGFFPAHWSRDDVLYKAREIIDIAQDSVKSQQLGVERHIKAGKEIIEFPIDSKLFIRVVIQKGHYVKSIFPVFIK